MPLTMPDLPATPVVGATAEAWNLYHAELQKVLADRQQIIVEAQLAASAVNSDAVARQTDALNAAREADIARSEALVGLAEALKDGVNVSAVMTMLKDQAASLIQIVQTLRQPAA